MLVLQFLCVSRTQVGSTSLLLSLSGKIDKTAEHGQCQVPCQQLSFSSHFVVDSILCKLVKINLELNKRFSQSQVSRKKSEKHEHKVIFNSFLSAPEPLEVNFYLAFFFSVKLHVRAKRAKTHAQLL